MSDLKRQLYVLIPAHNEESQVEEALESVWGQSSLPSTVVVICDNCTDRTEEVVLQAAPRFPGETTTFRTVENKKKKAGGLNQWLTANLPDISGDDLILVMDADSALCKDFCRNAISRIEAGYSACGGVFQGKPGGGIVGMFQRNEYARYARDVSRKDGETLVLTGTATVFLAGALKEVVTAREAGVLPCVDGEAHVYDTGALTEDNELTFALLHLGHMIIAPRECALTTEVMPTWRQLWHQRRRWKRGAAENNLQYGITKVTLKYWWMQVWGALGILATALYLGTMAYAIVTGSLHIRAIWIGVTIIYAIERMVTVRERGLLQVLLAGTLFVEMAYDISLQCVHAVAFIDVATKSKKNW